MRLSVHNFKGLHQFFKDENNDSRTVPGQGELLSKISVGNWKCFLSWLYVRVYSNL